MSSVDRDLDSLGSTITSMNSSRFLVTAKIETPKDVRMSTDLGICSSQSFMSWLSFYDVCLGFIHSIVTCSLHFFALQLPMTTFGKIGQRQHFNNQRIEEKRPRPGRYWNPWRLVSWKILQWTQLSCDGDAVIKTFETANLTELDPLTFCHFPTTLSSSLPHRASVSWEQLLIQLFVVCSMSHCKTWTLDSTDLRKSALQPLD